MPSGSDSSGKADTDAREGSRESGGRKETKERIHVDQAVAVVQRCHVSGTGLGGLGRQWSSQVKVHRDGWT